MRARRQQHQQHQQHRQQQQQQHRQEQQQQQQHYHNNTEASDLQLPLVAGDVVYGNGIALGSSSNITHRAAAAASTTKDAYYASTGTFTATTTSTSTSSSQQQQQQHHHHQQQQRRRRRRKHSRNIMWTKRIVNLGRRLWRHRVLQPLFGPQQQQRTGSSYYHNSYQDQDEPPLDPRSSFLFLVLVIVVFVLMLLRIRQLFFTSQNTTTTITTTAAVANSNDNDYYFLWSNSNRPLVWLFSKLIGNNNFFSFFGKGTDDTTLLFPILIPYLSKYKHRRSRPFQPIQRRQRQQRHIRLKSEEEQQKEEQTPDYGGLNIDFATETDDMDENSVFARQILYDGPFASHQVEWFDRHDMDDDVSSYYMYDDDFKRNPYQEYSDDTLKYSHECRRTNWHRLQFPTCNILHETGFRDAMDKYLDSGFYRDVFLLDSNDEKFVVKQFRQKHDFTYDQYEFVHMDVLVSERMMGHEQKNMFVSIYGSCGGAIVSEYFARGTLEEALLIGDGYSYGKDAKELYNDGSLVSQMKAVEKLAIALEMAVSIAYLHGFPDGVIVHDDIQPTQWLLNENGQMKLNDFNRAEIMLFDEENGEYCKYKNGAGGGSYRAPEEYFDKPLDEKIDVYSYGNNLFVLLTGLWPRNEIEDDEVSVQLVKKGKPVLFDEEFFRSLSYGNSVLLDVMFRCWEYEPEDRADIFEVVQTLAQALQEQKKLDEEEEKMKQKKESN